MTKAQLIDLIKEYPDDYEILFTQEDEQEQNEHYEMFIDSVTDSKTKEYVNLYFRYTTPHN